MHYYIITDSIARTLGLTRYRSGNATDGWLANQSDLAVYGTERALDEGCTKVSEREAREFVKSLKTK